LSEINDDGDDDMNDPERMTFQAVGEKA